MKFQSSKQRKYVMRLYNKSFAGVRRAGFKLSPDGDFDHDGVKNKNDCRPLNPHKQDETYELRPQYDSRASFYGKARVETEDGVTKLISYSTKVAEIKDGKPIVYGTYSATTLRHIKEFLKQHGFKADSSKQIMKDYGG